MTTKVRKPRQTKAQKEQTAKLLASSNLGEYVAAGGQPDSAENQRIRSDLVHREVLHCCSSMVYELTRHGQDIGDYRAEELMELCERRVDHSERLEEIEEELDALGSDLEDGEENAKQIEVERQRLEDERDELRQEQDEPCEVYEHWAVSSFFARKLREHGETVGELFDFTIWGRTCTGQGIAMDYIIAEIAADMQILQGQQYDWSKAR